MVTCAGCGRVNPDEARFCGGCGQALAVVAAESPTPDEQVPAPGPSRSPSLQAATASMGEQAGTWQRVVMGLAALLLLLGGVVSVWGVPALVAGLGLGFATARPPRSRILRWLVVTFGFLVLLLTFAAIILFLWIFFYYPKWY